MSGQFKNILDKLKAAISSVISKGATSGAAGVKFGTQSASSLTQKIAQNSGKLLTIGALAGASYAVYSHPPLKHIDRGNLGVRTNQFNGNFVLMREGTVWVIPGLHELRQYSLQDQTYRPDQSGNGNNAPFQSIEGLSLGADVTVRYALNPEAPNMKNLPEDIDGDLVDPAVQGVVYKIFSRYTVREIFSSKRQEIQQQIESELKPKLVSEGLLLRSVMIGKIDLPDDYKRGMEQLLAKELESERMRYTLELKEKQVKESEFEAQADKVRRETAAEAAANEQIIAAKAQEEAMKHVLPFKQKQIEQRQYEAEADKVSRIKMSEGLAQARIIEATGEADSRRKLADAEAYRQDMIGKIASSQLERDGELISKNPLLIQKVMADKLSDKVSVIIAAPPTDGGFIGSNLLGSNKTVAAE